MLSSRLAKAVCVAVVTLMATSTIAAAVDFAGTTCDDAINPIASLDLSAGDYAACLQARCMATTGAAPTAPSADGQCDGTGAAEAASTQTCDSVLQAFNVYYACVLRTMGADASAPTEARTAFQMYANTPGVPYSVSPMPCYSCVNFYSVFANTALPAACRASYSCETCCGQNPLTNWIGDPGRGYNHVLCGDGCVTALMMTGFTLLSALIFLSCGCCWPSPSLKTTVAQYHREEDEARGKAANRGSSDDDRPPTRGGEEEEEEMHPQAERAAAPAEANSNSSARHEPVEDDEVYPTEPQAQEDTRQPPEIDRRNAEEL